MSQMFESVAWADGKRFFLMMEVLLALATHFILLQYSAFSCFFFYSHRTRNPCLDSSLLQHARRAVSVQTMAARKANAARAN